MVTLLLINKAASCLWRLIAQQGWIMAACTAMTPKCTHAKECLLWFTPIVGNYLSEDTSCFLNWKYLHQWSWKGANFSRSNLVLIISKFISIWLRGPWTFSKSPKGLSSVYSFRPFQKWLKQHPVGDSQIKYSLMLFWRTFSVEAHKAEFRIRKFKCSSGYILKKKKMFTSDRSFS